MPAWHSAQGSHLTLGAQGYTCLIFSRSMRAQIRQPSGMRPAACLSLCSFLWNSAFLALTTLPQAASPAEGPLLSQSPLIGCCDKPLQQDRSPVGQAVGRQKAGVQGRGGTHSISLTGWSGSSLSPALPQLMNTMQQVFVPQSPASPGSDRRQPPATNSKAPLLAGGPSGSQAQGGHHGLPLLCRWLQQPQRL